MLSGKYNEDSGNGESDAKRVQAIKEMLSENYADEMLSERNINIANEVVTIAKEIERTPPQVALNWLRQQPSVVIPIIGARKLSHVKDNLACTDFELSEEHMKRLNEVSEIKLGFPHDFVHSDEIRNLTFGGTHGLIDNHRI